MTADHEHLAALPRIELAAVTRFRGWDVPADMFDDADDLGLFEASMAAGRLWVALSSDDEPVGFARVEPDGERLHLAEMDVLPEHGGRGLGGALLDEVERWARENGFSALTLTTYRDVPWNGRFYERHGFVIVEPADLDRELAARLADEARRGLDSMPRVAMRKQLGGGRE
ncbi:MAG TPA: GNAT family N-acetyltransferase [Thermoleophilia bacterium]|nr:GNAT family N-acetyltransferase [Thermoleophilia bacterium]